MSRRNRLAALLAPAVFALVLAGCGTSSTPKSSSGGISNNLTNAFSFASASLPAYTADYAITGAGTGSMSVTVAQQGRSETLVKVHQEIATTVEDDTIVLTRKGLGFVSAKEDATAPGHHLTISAKVQGKKIVESATVDGKAESVSYPFTQKTLVNVALLAVLAGTDLHPGQLQIVQDVILKHGVAVPIGFTANDRTKVTTPAGTFSVVPVTLSGSGPNQHVYVDTQNHVMVKYVNNQTTISLTKLAR